MVENYKIGGSWTESITISPTAGGTVATMSSRGWCAILVSAANLSMLIPICSAAPRSAGPSEWVRMDGVRLWLVKSCFLVFVFVLLVDFLCPTPLSFGEEQGWWWNVRKSSTCCYCIGNAASMIFLDKKPRNPCHNHGRGFAGIDLSMTLLVWVIWHRITYRND